MTPVIQIPRAGRSGSCIVALHCSLGSGRQWTRLTAELGDRYRMIAPDISGYGSNPGGAELPTTLAQEVDDLCDRLEEAEGPIHLVGHSYGGGIAFRIATASPFAGRVRSLTLIEPVLPTLLCDDDGDRRLHDRFKSLAHQVYQNLCDGLVLEALEKFTAFWNGSGPAEPLSANTWLRMIEHANKLAFDFTAALGEADVKSRAAALRVPTLLFSGGLSPIMTQRIVERLAAIIAGADARHLPAAGHMLPITHAAIINPEIARHIAQADERAEAMSAV
ncbi:alpha/beta fold hydrolase [Bradyrhizobium sp.]|uniref:alpha/beta fold hydrolase n=1 Tax=Bradyrhizobium sp. TaxID=376 RepID=UPI003C781DFB